MEGDGNGSAVMGRLFSEGRNFSSGGFCLFVFCLFLFFSNLVGDMVARQGSQVGGKDGKYKGIFTSDWGKGRIAL